MTSSPLNCDLALFLTLDFPFISNAPRSLASWLYDALGLFEVKSRTTSVSSYVRFGCVRQRQQ